MSSAFHQEPSPHLCLLLGPHTPSLCLHCRPSHEDNGPFWLWAFTQFTKMDFCSISLNRINPRVCCLTNKPQIHCPGLQLVAVCSCMSTVVRVALGQDDGVWVRSSRRREIWGSWRTTLARLISMEVITVITFSISSFSDSKFWITPVCYPKSRDTIHFII